MKKKTNSTKLALAAMLTATAVVGSMLSFPVFASKCAPVQHIINILCAVFLGPGYGLAAAFLAALLRNLLGIGSLLAFPGSIFGAVLGGLVYRYTQCIWLTCIGEVVGTAVLGGLCAYPIAIAFMSQSAADLAFYAYIVPFLISTAVGSALSALLLYTMQHSGLLRKLQNGAEK